jgi:hypothetical protein
MVGSTNSKPQRIESPLRLIEKTRDFQGFSGAGSGAGLYLDLVRFCAIRCDVESQYK